MLYRVRWDVDVEADSHEEAARKARRIQRGEDVTTFCVDESHDEEPYANFAEEVVEIDNHERPGVRFVNAYSVDRLCGGREEGGWYYDGGTPLGSIPVETDAEEKVARELLTRTVGFENPRGRFSVIGGSDFEIRVEDHVARPFPGTRPRYE